MSRSEVDGRKASQAWDEHTDLPYELMMAIQRGTLDYRYRGVLMQKNPFDLALYARLLQALAPRTVIEIGSKEGGSALWFADQLSLLGIEGRVLSIDVQPVTSIQDPRIAFLPGDGRALGAVLDAETLEGLARPLLVVEDADHHFVTTAAVLEFFAPLLVAGEYIVVEDGILSAMGVADDYGGGPLRAIREFLARWGNRFRVDRDYCDAFGYNVTWNVNGYLRCLA